MLREFLQNIWQTIPMNNDWYSNLLSVCCTIAAAMFSAGVSLLTIAIAFIAAKRDVLKQLYCDKMNDGSSLSIARKIKATKRFIQNMQRITNMSINVIIVSLLSVFLYCVASFISSFLLFSCVLIMTILSIMFVFICIWRLRPLLYSDSN